MMHKLYVWLVIPQRTLLADPDSDERLSPQEIATNEAAKIDGTNLPRGSRVEVEGVSEGRRCVVATSSIGGFDDIPPGRNGQRELVNLTRRALEAERLLSQRIRELADVRQLLVHVQANHCQLKERELLALADELEGAVSEGRLLPIIWLREGIRAAARKIRSILNPSE